MLDSKEKLDDDTLLKPLKSSEEQLLHMKRRASEFQRLSKNLTIK